MPSPNPHHRQQRSQAQRHRLQPGTIVAVATGACRVDILAVDPPCHAFGAWRTDRWRDQTVPISRGLMFSPPPDIAADASVRFEAWSSCVTDLVIRITPTPSPSPSFGISATT